ncbi:MAG: DNA-deoxyinosine glycosylase [Methanomicrobiales archaeon]|nr:DNA-deoxyinosine glycosylase [Methanomicrobiales archaeon]
MNPASARLTGLPAVSGPSPRVLILGSFPSRLSLERGEYFANPRNRFWSLVEALLGIRADLPYGERARLLSSKRIALWDVVASCRREGSGDAAIRDPVANDLLGFLLTHQSIRLVALNGSTAGRLFHSEFRSGIRPELRVISLPSTSPANARFTLPKLVERWRIILNFTEE